MALYSEKSQCEALLHCVLDCSEETLFLSMKFKKVYRILNNDAEKASVKNRSVDWPDAGVYNM